MSDEHKEPNPNELFDDLQGQLVKRDVERIKGFLYNRPLAPNVLEECGISFPDICRELVKEKKIRPEHLDFDFLEIMFEKLKMLTLKDMVSKFVADAKSSRQEANEGRSGGSPPQSSTVGGGFIGVGNFPTIQADSVTINQIINTSPKNQEASHQSK